VSCEHVSFDADGWVVQARRFSRRIATEREQRPSSRGGSIDSQSHSAPGYQSSEQQAGAPRPATSSSLSLSRGGGGGSGESFMRVHWIAGPQALRARRVNRRVPRAATGLLARRGSEGRHFREPDGPAQPQRRQRARRLGTAAASERQAGRCGDGGGGGAAVER
jgi:hypothetical protein